MVGFQSIFHISLLFLLEIEFNFRFNRPSIRYSKYETDGFSIVHHYDNGIMCTVLALCRLLGQGTGTSVCLI